MQYLNAVIPIAGREIWRDYKEDRERKRGRREHKHMELCSGRYIETAPNLMMNYNSTRKKGIDVVMHLTYLSLETNLCVFYGLV